MEAKDRKIGELIKKMREAAGVTKEELAIAVGTCTSSITRWENGEDVSWLTLWKIAKELGYTVEIEVE